MATVAMMGLIFLVLILVYISKSKIADTFPVSLANILDRMAGAIMQFEGWHEGSRSYRNNNPGNLKFAGQDGAVAADDEGHAVFASFDAGWAALIHQLEISFNGQSAVYSPEDSLYDFFGKYAEANGSQYAKFVADKLGVAPETTLNQLGGLS